MEIGNITPYIPETDSSNLTNKLQSAYSEKDDKKLKEACEGFESYFLNMMLKEMRKTVPESESDSSYALNMYQEMLDEEIAENASKGKGIGIGDMMYNQLSSKLRNSYKVEE